MYSGLAGIVSRHDLVDVGDGILWVCWHLCRFSEVCAGDGTGFLGFRRPLADSYSLRSLNSTHAP